MTTEQKTTEKPIAGVIAEQCQKVDKENSQNVMQGCLQILAKDGNTLENRLATSARLLRLLQNAENKEVRDIALQWHRALESLGKLTCVLDINAAVLKECPLLQDVSSEVVLAYRAAYLQSAAAAVFQAWSKHLLYSAVEDN